MADSKSHWPASAYKHTVIASEVSSGVADVTMFTEPRDRDMIYIVKVETLSGVVKSDGFKNQYVSASGIVRVTNGTSSLATGDVISTIGMRFV